MIAKEDKEQLANDICSYVHDHGFSSRSLVFVYDKLDNLERLFGAKMATTVASETPSEYETAPDHIDAITAKKAVNKGGRPRKLSPTELKSRRYGE